MDSSMDSAESAAYYCNKTAKFRQAKPRCGFPMGKIDPSLYGDQGFLNLDFMEFLLD
jgi:hypothetical protein